MVRPTLRRHLRKPEPFTSIPRTDDFHAVVVGAVIRYLSPCFRVCPYPWGPHCMPSCLAWMRGTNTNSELATAPLKHARVSALRCVSEVADRGMRDETTLPLERA
jgi:hypothetical protein